MDEIGREIAEVGQRIDQTNKWIDEINKRIDETNKRIDNLYALLLDIQRLLVEIAEKSWRAAELGLRYRFSLRGAARRLLRRARHSLASAALPILYKGTDQPLKSGIGNFLFYVRGIKPAPRLGVYLNREGGVHMRLSEQLDRVKRYLALLRERLEEGGDLFALERLAELVAQSLLDLAAMWAAAEGARSRLPIGIWRRFWRGR
ncbi:hypothetical protein [Thermoproteus uzoniensis]|uniref:hypothetical protein n=1 Tax=Thermoproteus uzoniensis TaxID=184117 RepID=UPI000A786C06